MKKLLLIGLMLPLTALGQIGMGTTKPEKSAVVHVESETKGFILSRMTNEQRKSIKNPANGLMVYVTDAYWQNGHWHGRLFIYDGANHWIRIEGTVIFESSRSINTEAK